MLALSAGWAVFISTKVQTVMTPADGGHALLRPLIATDAIAFYVYKLIFPLKLGFHYDRAPLTVIRAGWLYYTWTVPASVALLILIFRKKAPWLLPSAALFIIGIAPVLGLIPFAFQRYATVADRYVYISMLGPALALAALLTQRFGTDGMTPQSRRIVILTVAAILTVFGLRSFIQTWVWRNNVTFFANGLWVNPRSFAANDGMAGVLASDGQFDPAKNFAERAVACDPGQSEGYITLGAIYTRLGDMTKAIESFRKAVEISPRSPEALTGLGGALAAKGEWAEAEKLLRQAIQIRPETADAHANLGVLFYQMRRYEDSFHETSLAVRYDPGNPNSQWRLFVLLNGHGDRGEALEHLRTVLQLDPNYPHAQEAYMQLTGTRP